MVRGSRCTLEESESGRMDTILANPKSSSILLEHSISSLLSRRLLSTLFLRLRLHLLFPQLPLLPPPPPASPAASPPPPFPVPSSTSLHLFLFLFLSQLQLESYCESSCRFPDRIGYSVMAHEHRLISIPTYPPSSPSRNYHGSAALSGYVRQILSRIPGFSAP